MILVVFLALYAAIVTTALCIFVKKSIELNDKIDAVEEQIGESLDVLDDCYASIYQKSKLEVMSDEPIIRELMSDITRSRNAVLLVSRKINGDQEGVETT